MASLGRGRGPVLQETSDRTQSRLSIPGQRGTARPCARPRRGIGVHVLGLHLGKHREGYGSPGGSIDHVGQPRLRNPDETCHLPPNDRRERRVTPGSLQTPCSSHKRTDLAILVMGRNLMPQARIRMNRIREIIRLHETARLSIRQISQALGVSRPVVDQYLRLAHYGRSTAASVLMATATRSSATTCGCTSTGASCRCISSTRRVDRCSSYTRSAFRRYNGFGAPRGCYRRA